MHLQAGSLRAHRRSFRRFVNDGAEFERSLGTQHGALFLNARGGEGGGGGGAWHNKALLIADAVLRFFS